MRLNSSPLLVDQLNRIPIKVVNEQPVLLRDVAHVRDGSPPQTNIVRADGKHSVLLQVLKNGSASTLDVVNAVKAALPNPRGLAEGLDDHAALRPVGLRLRRHRRCGARGGDRGRAYGAGDPPVPGSWRSTLVVLVSIPLCILTSLAVLVALGQTINVMTLGGLALAVGILVDDATVAIENTYRMFEEGHPFRRSVLEGVAGIAKPALISTLAICSAFSAVFFLSGAPRYLFVPQAEAVVFAMLASYLLSRTLVAILIDVLVAPEYARHHGGAAPAPGRPSRLMRLPLAVRDGFERAFTRFHAGYVGLLGAVIRHPGRALAAVACVFAVTASLFPFVGQNYFHRSRQAR